MLLNFCGSKTFSIRLRRGRWIADVDRGKGRLRPFLLASLKRFLAKEWDYVQGRQHEGDVALMALDAQSAEERYALRQAPMRTLFSSRPPVRNAKAQPGPVSSACVRSAGRPTRSGRVCPTSA